MTDFAVRAVRPEEFAELGELTALAFAETIARLGDGGYADELRDIGGRVAAAEVLAAVDSGGELLGSVTVVWPGTELAEISTAGELEFRMLAVAHRARGRGVGEALVRAVIARARGLGSSRVVLSTLESSGPAQRLYQRLGFTRRPERDWQPAPGLWLFAHVFDL